LFIPDLGSGSGSCFFLLIPDLGSRGQKGTGSRIRIRNTENLWFLIVIFREQEASLYEGLKRMTKGRLDDQRGLEINAELPEFLR
jgi:hypothetical protein